jgi:SAM-dependent methyltransferase
VTFAERVSAFSRARKMRLFMDAIRPDERTTVLDVGVDNLGYGEAEGWTTANFFEELYPWRERITAVGIHDGERFRSRYWQVAYVQADGCELPFADDEFDVVFSNAVVEHLQDRERQRRFISEATRVGRCAFLATPNRRFPVEVHTRLPFVHWLPSSGAGRVYDLLGKSWARELELLSASDLRSLFPSPDRVRIIGSVPTLVALVP